MQRLGDDPPDSFRVGQRVHFAGDPRRIGTVRYVGPVAGHSGDWVGIDWDDGGGGKHDGAVDGVRYFTARCGKSGSFVRPHNLSAGISLLEALDLRYRGDYSEEDEEEMYVLSTTNKRVSVEFVGKNKIQEKLSRFEEMRSVCLSYLGVSSTGAPHQISYVVPNLKELDLTGNLLSKWQDFAAICEELPDLEVLNITNNLLMNDFPVLPVFKSIHVLVLNNCGLMWEQLEILKESLPAIEELHLISNKLSSISPSSSEYVQGFESLRLLNLEENCIKLWNEVIKLSQLPSLEELHLNKNNLDQILYPDADEMRADGLREKSNRPFENLRCLLLGGNRIKDLESVDPLSLFPSLMDIRLSDNPVADPGMGGIPRYVLIARLAKVQILNGSEISPRERKESEIRYVRFVMSKLQPDNVIDIRHLHPRFEELKELHGIDEKPAIITSGAQKMASGLLSVTLECVGPSMGEKQPVAKTLPASTTVAKLKFLCESFFKLKSAKPRLFLKEKDSPLPILLDDDMASLMELGIQGGSTILVDDDN